MVDWADLDLDRLQSWECKVTGAVYVEPFGVDDVGCPCRRVTAGCGWVALVPVKGGQE